MQGRASGAAFSISAVRPIAAGRGTAIFPGMAPALQIRPARPSDLTALDALFARSYGRLLAADYPPSVLVTAVPLLARAQPALLASGRYYVAVEAGGALLGAGGWSMAAPGGGAAAAGLGHVRHVVTDATRTRQGIGRAIMTRTLAEAAAAGISRLDCLATRTAVPFYAALGFVALGPVEVPLAAGIVFPAVRMQLRF